MRIPHIATLNSQALVVLKEMTAISDDHNLIFNGDHNPEKPMSKNNVNKALRGMCYDTKIEVCGQGFRAMARSCLNGVWIMVEVYFEASNESLGTYFCACCLRS